MDEAESSLGIKCMVWFILITDQLSRGIGRNLWLRKSISISKPKTLLVGLILFYLQYLLT